MHARQISLFLAAVLAIATAGQAAKKTPTPRPIGGLTFSDSYELSVVNIDVFVADKGGTPVTDLKQGDFQVFQDGQEKEITNFAVYTQDVYRTLYQRPTPGLAMPTPTPLPDAEPAPEIKPIFMVIYIDNQNLRPLDRNRVLRQLRQFVRANLRPPTKMMVVNFDRSLKVLQGFTTDPGHVITSLRSLRMHTGGRTERDSARKEVLEMMRKYQDQENASGGRGTNDQYNGPHQVNRLMMGWADEEANNLAFTIGSLRQVISILAGLPGRKSVLYVSDGLQMVPGIDLFYEYSNIYQDTDVLNLISRYDRTRLFKSLVSTASSQGVTFFTLGAQGLQMAGMGSAEHRYAQTGTSMTVINSSYVDSLRYMADGTGGRAIVNTNDFEGGLEKVAADLYTYYSLGYSITATGRDKIHRIKVVLRNNPGYTVRYRRHFVEKSIESNVQDRVMTSLVFPVAENPMTVDVKSGSASPATNEWWTVPIHVSFPIDSIALLPEGEEYVGRVILFVAARDQKGKQSDLQRQEHEVRIPAADYDKAKQQRFGLDLSLLMESGSYRVGVGLLDQVTQQASYVTARVRVNP